MLSSEMASTLSGMLHVEQQQVDGSFDDFFYSFDETGDFLDRASDMSFIYDFMLDPELPTDDGTSDPIDEPDDPVTAEDDHADTPGSDATPITLGDFGFGFGEGTLEEEGDRDVFGVTVEESGLLFVNLFATDGFDTHVRLFDESGSLIDENDDLGIFFFNSGLQTPVDAGTYYISVGAFEDSETGDYVFDVFHFDEFDDEFPDPDDEPHHDPGEDQTDEIGDAAEPIELADGFATVWATIDPAGDRDVFQFTTEDDGFIFVDMFGGEFIDAWSNGVFDVRGNDGLQPVLEVFDSSGNLIVDSNDGFFFMFGDCDSSFVDFDVEAGETYYVVASSADPDGVGDYTLDFWFETDFEDDPIDLGDDQHADDPGPDATLFEFEDRFESFDAVLNFPGDRDVFQFMAPDSGLVFAEAFSFDGDLDTYLEVFSFEGELIVASDDDSVVDFGDSFVEFDAAVGATYFIAVSSTDPDGVGFYGLDVFAEFGEDDPHDDPHDDPPEMEDLHADDPGPDATLFEFEDRFAFFDAVINFSGDRDVFQSVAPESGLVFAEAFSFDGELDTYLEVFDFEGELIVASDDDSFDDFGDSSVEFDAEVGATYFIAVSSTDPDGVGFYGLDVFAEFGEDDPHVDPPEMEDLHADDPGPDATLFEFEDRFAFFDAVINFSGDRDVFQLIASESGLVFAEAFSFDGDLDTYLEVFDSEGQLIVASDDDSVDDFGDSYVEFDTEPGATYYIAVSSTDPDGVGFYGLDVFAEFGEDDPHDDPPEMEDRHVDDPGPDATLFEIEDGFASFDAVINFSGDRDMFQLIAPESGLVFAEAFSFDGDLDTYLEIFNFEGELIVASDDDSVDDFGDSYVEFDTEVGATYYIAESSTDPDGVGLYGLDVFAELGEDDHNSDIPEL